jgi:hypothetical protein
MKNEFYLHLKQWEDLFNSLPKYHEDYFPFVHQVDLFEEAKMYEGKYLDTLVLIVEFHPSSEFYESTPNHGMELHLVKDGTAFIDIGSTYNYDKYSHLYNFTGNWKEAYNKVLTTMKEGWPRLNFPTGKIPQNITAW